MRYLIALAVLLLATGCAYFGPSIDEQLKEAKSVGGPVFYLGDEYGGLPLTGVQAGSDDGNAHGADFIYGDCEIEDGAEMCPAPLDVQNAVCPEGTRIVIYATDLDAREVARHLRQLGGGDAVPHEVRFDHATLCGT